jgi:hypothetical protein
MTQLNALLDPHCECWLYTYSIVFPFDVEDMVEACTDKELAYIFKLEINEQTNSST